MATEGATVPSARVDETTGEPFFTPDTVDRLQEILEKQMEEREDAEWQEFAYRSFAAGYDDDEPEYSEEDGTKSSVSVGLCEACLPLGHLHCVTVRRLGCQGTVVSEKQTRAAGDRIRLRRVGLRRDRRGVVTCAALREWLGDGN